MGTSRKLLRAATLAILLIAFSAAPALAAPPANDNMDAPAALDGNRGQTSFDLTESTFETGEPTPGGTDRISVWFAYTPNADGVANFSICQRDSFLTLAGASVAAFPSDAPTTAPYDPSTGGCPSGEVNAAFNGFAVESGETYLVQVAASNTTEIVGGTLVYDFNAATPPNDDFADAQEITGALPQTIDADNGLATREDAEPGLEIGGPNNSLWYRWTPETDGTVSIDTCQTAVPDSSTAPDSQLSIYTSSDDPVELAGLSLNASGDDGCAQPKGLLTHKYVNVFAGTEYWIRLANHSDQFGTDYKLRLRWVGAPETSEAPYVNPTESPAYVGQMFFGGSHEWAAYPGVTEVTAVWLRCNAAGDTCAEIAGESGSTYIAQTADIGSRLAIRVSATNGDDTTTLDSNLTAVIEPEPTTEEPGGGGGTTDPPPAPTDPVPSLTVPKSLGKLKLSKKNTISISKLNLVCGAAATGPCTGTLRISTPRTKLKGKTIKPMKLTFKLSAAPGAKASATFKLSAGAVKAIKIAKTLKAKVGVTFGAPGWPPKTAAASATLAK